MLRVYPAQFKSMLVGLFLGICMPLTATAAPLSLYAAKQAVISYHNSGEYDDEIAKVVAEAKRYSAERIYANASLRHPKKLAVVFDIDETLLSNFDDLVAMDFGGTERGVMIAEKAGHDARIEQTYRLYNWLKAQNVTLFFVTARREHLREATVRNLKSTGFSSWKHLYLMPNHYKLKSAAPFKTKMRKHIEAKGYDILFSMGDQESDLRGGHADRMYKLPNPFYFVQ